MRIRATSIISSPSSFSTNFAHSLSSASNSLPSSQSNLNHLTHCEGLDLLVKAAIHVAGEFFMDAPITQRRVIRRRIKKTVKIRELSINEVRRNEEEKKLKKEEDANELISMTSTPKKQKRVKFLPSKYGDSVLQPWKRKTRKRRSNGISG